MGTNRNGRLTGIILLILALGALALAGCAPQAAAPADGAAVDTSPSLIAPNDYVSRFVDASADHILIDVRTPDEFNSGHIAGSVNIPVQELGARLSEVPQDKTVVVYCRSGNRSAQAATILDQAGYTPVYDLGGVIGWTAAGYGLQ